MAAGLPVDRAQLDRDLGTALRDLRNVFYRLRNIKKWTDQRTAADLVAQLGYDLVTEANVLKSAIADAGQLIDIFDGDAALPAAKEFDTFIQQLWGLGGQG
jgi:hypothetical protein